MRAGRAASMGELRKSLWKYKSQLIVVLTPILLLPLPLASSGELTLCGYAVILMGVFWMTEAVPLPITAFLPIILMPAFGIMTTREVCELYLTSTNTVIMGGCIVALAIENTHLHRRIAVKVLLTVGAKPRWLMLGFQLTTWFLSMCITNTATVAMMLPILHAVVSQVDKDEDDDDEREHHHHHARNRRPSSEIMEIQRVASDFDHFEDSNINGAISMITIRSSGELKEDAAVKARPSPPATDTAEQKEQQALFLALTMSVVYAANIGGIATLTGTGPNLILKKTVDDLWNKHNYTEAPINFSTWMVYGLPISAINMMFLWTWLQIFYFGIRNTLGCGNSPGSAERENRIKKVMLKERDKLGPIRYSECVVGILFILLVCLWFFRKPGFIQGWAAFFKNGYMGTATPAMVVVFILFIVPMDIPGRKHGGKLETILSWPLIQRKFPWGVIFLMGGGFAIAGASIKTGLSVWIGRQLNVFRALPGFVMIYMLCFAIGILTEVTSNVAICTMLMPIVASMAEDMGRSPLYLMLPVGVSSSFAFMLPVANPPNALGFEFAQMKIMDMVKPGCVMKLLSILPVTIITQTWGYSFYNFDRAPWQIQDTNITTAIPTV